MEFFGIHLTYFALALLGIAAHILTKMLNRSNKSGKISIKYYFSNKRNVVELLLSLVCAFSILFMAEELSDFARVKLSDGSTPTGIIAFVGGYLNNSIIRLVLRIFKAKTTSSIEE